MKNRNAILVLLILFIPFQFFARLDGYEINAELGNYSHPIIFANLSEHLKEFKPYFQSIAFVILTSALIFALKRANEPQSYLGPIAFSGILIVLIAQCSFFLQLGNDTIYSLNKALKVDSTYMVANRLYNAALNFYGVNEEKVKNPARAAEMDARSNDALGEESAISSFDFLKNPFGILMKGIKMMVVMIIGAIISVVMALCSFLVIILETIRYFLIQCGALILPIFLAGLMTQSFRSQSITFIFGLIGILCWPLGWSLGHIGTTALFEGIIETVNRSIIIEEGRSHKVIEILSEINDPWSYVHLTKEWLVVGDISMLLWLMLLFLGIVIWVVIVTLCAPFLIQRSIASGAQFFSGIAGAAAQTVSGAIGGLGSYAMVRSARSTSMSPNGERPQPSRLLRAGFAGARTMMNASRFQGDPSQVSQIFDSGLDELRHYRAEAAQVDLGRTARGNRSESNGSSSENSMMRNASKKARDLVKK